MSIVFILFIDCSFHFLKTLAVKSQHHGTSKFCIKVLIYKTQLLSMYHNHTYNFAGLQRERMSHRSTVNNSV